MAEKYDIDVDCRGIVRAQRDIGAGEVVKVSPKALALLYNLGETAREQFMRGEQHGFDLARAVIMGKACRLFGDRHDPEAMAVRDTFDAVVRMQEERARCDE